MLSHKPSKIQLLNLMDLNTEALISDTNVHPDLTLQAMLDPLNYNTEEPIAVPR
jgi:hypothetical protein